jgi:hypothetical protein
MLPSLLLAALAGLPPVHIDVLAGRAELASPLGIVPLRSGEKPLERHGPGYIEVAALSRLNLRWRGITSLELDGASALEWRGSARDEDGLTLEVLRMDRLSAEVRRGPLRLELPGGWRATLTHGALHVRTLSNGALELEHIAGAPLLLAAAPVEGRLSPPWTVLAGSKVLLEPSAEQPRSSAGRKPLAQERRDLAWAQPATHGTPWTSFRWPWSEPVVADSKPAVDVVRRAKPWGTDWKRQ